MKTTIHHEFIVGRSRTNFLQYTLQINTDSIEEDALIAVANYLIDHINVVYDKYPEMLEDVMWPVVIKLNNKVIISESAFWKLIFDTFTDGYHYLERYINKLNELAKTTEFKTLLQSNEYQFHGGLAFNQYWLWRIEGPLAELEDITKSIKLYSLWLSQNDLDIETSEDDFFNIIFEHYKSVDNITLATLLAQRLVNGQLSEKGFDFLKKAMIRFSSATNCGLLKEVINQLFNEEIHCNGPCYKESLIYELCAVFYGNNEQRTNEVMNYAKSIVKSELWPIQEFQLAKINYLRQVGDIYWQNTIFHERYIDTSFHLFDTHTRKWINYDERE